MSQPIRRLFPTSISNRREQSRLIGLDINVSFPAIVNVVNENGTVDVQPAIRERVVAEDNTINYLQLPIIPNVPVCFPSAGGFSFTMPISEGDECLVIIADQSFDNWWLNGGIQNPIEQRRHDLTDAFAIFGIRSIPNSFASVEGATIRSPEGTTLTVKDGNISILIPSGENFVSLTATENSLVSSFPTFSSLGSVSITGNLSVSGNLSVGGKITASQGLTVSGTFTLNGVNIGTHVHTSGEVGSNTGGPKNA